MECDRFLHILRFFHFENNENLSERTSPDYDRLWKIIRVFSSSVSIVSGYGQYDWAIEVRSPAGAKDFSSSLCVQTSSEAHPASCTVGTGDPFPGGEARPGRDADHSPPSSAEAENE
jgi:hypothetical protein